MVFFVNCHHLVIYIVSIPGLYLYNWPSKIILSLSLHNSLKGTPKAVYHISVCNKCASTWIILIGLVSGWIFVSIFKHSAVGFLWFRLPQIWPWIFSIVSSWLGCHVSSSTTFSVFSADVILKLTLLVSYLKFMQK